MDLAFRILILVENESEKLGIIKKALASDNNILKKKAVFYISFIESDEKKSILFDIYKNNKKLYLRLEAAKSLARIKHEEGIKAIQNEIDTTKDEILKKQLTFILSQI